MVKWGTAYPTSRRNFFLITFNWVANALVRSFYLSISCYKVYNGLTYCLFTALQIYSLSLSTSSRCIMDWATTLQTSMWAHTWASSSALPLRLAFILGFQQFRQTKSHLSFQVPSYFLGWWVMDKWGRRWILFETMMIGIYPRMWPWWNR